MPALKRKASRNSFGVESVNLNVPRAKPEAEVERLLVSADEPEIAIWLTPRCQSQRRDAGMRCLEQTRTQVKVALVAGHHNAFRKVGVISYPLRAGRERASGVPL
jgi:hypothetical protein